MPEPEVTTAPDAPAEPAPAQPNLPATQDEEPRTIKMRDIKIGAAGINFTNAAEVMAFAKMMASSDKAVRPEFRENPGACLAVIDDAIRFGMSPYALARKAYFVNNQLAYEAQAIAAIIIARAPIQDMPEYTYEGEGGNRVCIVTVKTVTGRVINHRSPTFARITPKNSPLWVSDPDQQQGYYTVRAMARLHFPHVLLGIYDLEEAAAARASDITPKPKLADFSEAARLAGAKLETTVVDHKSNGVHDKSFNGASGSGGGNSGDAMLVAPIIPAGASTSFNLSGGGGGGSVAVPPAAAGAVEAMEAELAKPRGAPHAVKGNLERSLMAELAEALKGAKTSAEVDVVEDEFRGAMNNAASGVREVMLAALSGRRTELTGTSPTPTRGRRK